VTPRTAIASFCALAAIACGDGTGPGQRRPVSVTLNQLVSGQLGPGEQVDYRFAPPSTMAIALELTLTTGGVSVTVKDSSGQLLTSLTAGGLPPSGTSWRTSYVLASSPGWVDIRLTPTGSTPSAFQVRVIGVGLGPEHHASTIAPNDTVQNEVIDDRSDQDVFELDVTGGTPYVFFAQGLLPDTAPRLKVEVWESLGDRDPRIYLEVGGESDFEIRRGYYSPATTRRVSVRVSPLYGSPIATSSVVDPYRFVMRAIRFEPERLARRLPLNDTVAGESIDHVGDVDEFVVSASPGEEFNLFMQSFSTSPGTGFTADLLWSSGGRALLEAVVQGTALGDRASGRFAGPTADSFRIRVRAPDGFAGLPRGPYRMQLYLVHRPPESATGRVLALGDSVVGETIGILGDVDEFTLTVPSDTAGALFIGGAPTTPMPGLWVDPPVLTVEELGTAQLVGGTLALQTTHADSLNGTGLLRLRAGSYLVRVEGNSSMPGGFTGAFRLVTAAFDTLPERRPSWLEVGDTAVEAIQPAGDVDLYRFRGRRADPVRLCLQLTGTPTEGRIEAGIGAPFPAYPSWLARAGGDQPTPTMCALDSRRLTLPSDTVYSVTVKSFNGGRFSGERSPYRLSLLPYPVAPEHVPTGIGLGDSVGAERLDEPGDVDEFLLSASAGAEVQTWLLSGAGAVTVEALHPASFDSLRATMSTSWVSALGRVRVPTEGALRLRFFERRAFGCPGDCGVEATGPFAFWVRGVDRGPETASPVVVVGDTVSAEVLDYEGDIDEFTFAATGGDTVEVYLQFPTGYLSFTGARLELVAPDGSPVGSVQGGNPTPTLETLTTGRLHLPLTGTYVVRVLGNDDRLGSGAYRFRVVR